MQLNDEIRQFLDERLIARITTMEPNGYPHTVPIWYIRDGDDLVISTGPESRKVKNIRDNPKGAVTVGGEPVDDHKEYGLGYLFQGEWSLEGEPEFEWVRKIAFRYLRDHERVEQNIAMWGAHQALRFKIHKVSKVMG